MMSRLSLLGVTVGIGVIVVAQACGSSSTEPSQADVVAACMHICQCEAGASDPSFCDMQCTSAQPGGSLSSSGFPSSLSLSFSGGSFDYTAADQACAKCFATAACSDIINGTACPGPCQ
jgi:hypothetical protein